jgi:hypothetical protein
MYFLPDGKGVHFTGSATFNEYVSIIAGDVINLPDSSDIIINPAGSTWKPYGGIEGSGILLYSNFEATEFSKNAISITSDNDAEGIIYAPQGGCQLSGAATYTGGLACWQLDTSGSTGQIIFNIAWCPPPNPQIWLAE